MSRSEEEYREFVVSRAASLHRTAYLPDRSGAEQPFTPDVSAIEHRVRQARRRDRIVRGGIGIGVVAVAVVAAVGVASAVSSTPAGTAQASGAHPAKTGASTSPAGSTHAQPPLATSPSPTAGSADLGCR